MKKSIFIPLLNETFELNEVFNVIIVEDPIAYRNLYYDDLDSYIYCEEGKIIELNKKIAKIENPLSLNINDKKLLNGLYKSLEGLKNSEIQEKLGLIESDIISIMDCFIERTSFSLEYNDQIDISKLFSMIQLRFREYSTIDYLNCLLSFVNINIELFDIKLIISFGLANYISEEEMADLKKELELLGVIIFDFSFRKKSTNSAIIVDNDWCLI